MGGRPTRSRARETRESRGRRWQPRRVFRRAIASSGLTPEAGWARSSSPSTRSSTAGASSTATSKPENIMLGRFGETLVVDWGVAKATSDPRRTEGGQPGASPGGEDSSLTRPGATVGTPRYMSPEQALGNLEQVGPA